MSVLKSVISTRLLASQRSEFTNAILYTSYIMVVFYFDNIEKR